MRYTEKLEMRAFWREIEKRNEGMTKRKKPYYITFAMGFRFSNQVLW